jgi:hypothetical protein
VRRVAADTPDVWLIEYGVVVDLLDETTEAEWLPDGIHPTEEAAATIWSTFLGPALEDIVRSGRVGAGGPDGAPPGGSDPTVTAVPATTVLGASPTPS